MFFPPDNISIKKMGEKKPIYKRWWIWVIGVLVLFFIIGSSSKEPEKVGSVETQTTQSAQNNEPAKTEIFKIGDKVKLEDYILTVNEVRGCISDNQFNQPKAGNRFVAVDITQENTGATPRDYNVWYFKLQDSEDFSYQTVLVGCKEPYFGSGVLQNGQKTRGYITFEIPNENSPTQLIFTPNWWARGQVTVELLQ